MYLRVCVLSLIFKIHVFMWSAHKKSKMHSKNTVQNMNNKCNNIVCMCVCIGIPIQKVS